MRAVYMCSVEALPAPGQLLEFTVEGRAVCVANDQGRLSAVDNVCPHRQAPLAEGSLEKGRVVCPWHGWAFDLTTGAAEHAPAATVDVLSVQLRGPEVWLALKD